MSIIDPFEMAGIYWRSSRGKAIFEVNAMIAKLKSVQAKTYWGEVLIHLGAKKNGKKSLQ